jgi:hypothetical protein
MNNEYTEARKRVWDDTLWSFEDDPGRRIEYSYRESPESCKTPSTGVITYPCCAFCGIRTGSDNRSFVSGHFHDNACEIAWDLRQHKRVYTEEELKFRNKRLKEIDDMEIIRHNQLRQLNFSFL